MNLNFEEISFQIIAFAGEAKGHAMNAIYLAKQGKYSEADELLEKAEQSMIIAEKTHMDVVSAEAGGEKLVFPVLFVHAEDQLLTTQTLMLIAKEFVDVYKKINN
ncbi:PTS system, cellobiose-specific IIA component [Williamsoniiplasma somnilux]|uniref:PTS system, cellobiose-specific IIA component n=1 Tax=Williamsoniiplasma somnilux TaxID=215578 RepID=A0A2K8NYL5_9MOLU|nr:PTS lactose/cellobiose transporter subunit IIA [Williamsoniiplasma somnilux]ATZ18915.1 PTS system, cellobiose-specific IIA component [Williamsoniiplasma somnilux]